MHNIAITGLGHYLPKRVLSNSELEKMVETSEEWIISRTGIKERRIADKGEKTSFMAAKAAKEAINDAGVDIQDIDLIVVGTTTPDSNFPSVACWVQKELNAKNAACFDVSAACSGFLFALTTAKQYISSGMFKNAIVVGADKFTNLIDWNDRSTCVLFGDGAGAVVLSNTRSDHGILADYIHSLGEFGEFMQVIAEERQPLDQKSKHLAVPYALMRGQELFKIAVNSMSDAVEIVARKAKVKIDDIVCVVPHQANDRIIAAVAKKSKIPKERFFINIDKYGNMSAASCAVALYEAVKSGRIKKGDYFVIVAFGAGLVVGANLIKW
ncbi:MAG: ketoacyl-ACP synthase III [Candidatus Omnitrophica bacterium]|nr:ketoacyl-ACP synthase III [Candidatus Omnitrophota bacterium]